MRPILLALALAASPAAAQTADQPPIIWGGEARMGVLWMSDGPDRGPNFVTELELSATLRGQLDNGWNYGFTLELGNSLLDRPRPPGR